MSLMDRVSDPTPLRGNDRWRLGHLELEHRDKGSKWHQSWQVNWKDHYRIIEFSKLDFGAGFYLFDDHTSLNVFGLWVQLPIKPWRDPKDTLEKWGFCYLDNAMHFGWGPHVKIVYLPWDFQHIDEEYKVLLADGKTWQVMPRWRSGQPNPDERLDPLRWKASYPYRYMLHTGKVQQVTATVQVEKRQWRRRCLPAWFPLFKKKSTSIDVKFSEEVGERAGSWKGGCTACGYTMKPGETPADTLRRMERGRKFD